LTISIIYEQQEIVLNSTRIRVDSNVWEGAVVVVQSVTITANVVSSNPAHGEVYLIQHYVTKFISDLLQVGGFIRVLRFPPPKNGPP
jgi:hypothetical protein